ncbi:hypothetical protein BX616_004847 [Lobosporangium transversale]|uniref:polynucleotide adenylyltransferase n=1 Tax=Lobosporangium transversale TaxID=64571 RepID=A0A1Y2H124_9FUNG|nr:hypothetical protein BCR41DRAFT_299536 [Lobosporangium transversale]KAF9916010.1 hypothetical protein BX616_004847 [Lobosporangium transversale]ORZ27701.1 hypothetical protein BCR41DRAFT_299536 [Lobosporangium transversale]|eukprot:XP_021885404.1 hypothetical protein BCR41DRAFT_299536 [Lobosporangium transversale]
MREAEVDSNVISRCRPKRSEQRRSFGKDSDGFKEGQDFVRFESTVSSFSTTATTERLYSLVQHKRKRDAGSAMGDSDDVEDIESTTTLGPPPGCPWMGRRRYSDLPSAPMMLTQELKDFVAYISPTQEEHQVRTYVYQRVCRAVQALWDGAVVEVFGSFETQIYLPTSDIDMVVLRRGNFSAGELHELSRHLKHLKVTEDVECITRTKVPLIKFKENISQLSVDISFNVANGIQGAILTKQYMNTVPGLRPLTILIKHFLKLNRSNEPFHGGIGSFLTMVMVLSFLQMHPMIQSRMLDPEDNLGVLLIEFFELYGFHFNYSEVGIMVADGDANDCGISGTGGAYFPAPPPTDKKKKGSNRKRLGMNALDPNDVNNNIGLGARNIESIRPKFEYAFKHLVQNVESRHRDLENEGEEKRKGNGLQTSLLKNVFWIPDKIMESRRHIESVYYGRHFPNLFASQGH